MPADLKSILRLEVPLSVQIASRPMRVREISALSPGAIIELPKLADEQLDVTIGARRIGMGTAVKVGENFGVRITQVGSMRQRIAALGPDPAPAEPAAPAPLDPAVGAPEAGAGNISETAAEESGTEPGAAPAEPDAGRSEP